MTEQEYRKEILSEIAGNPIKFGQVVIPKMYELPTPKFHYDLEELFLDKENNPRVVIQAPRDSAKSSLVACVFALYHIFMEEGDKFVVLGSKSLPHAKRLLGTIKNTLEFSKTFRAIFGYYGIHSPSVSKWNETDVSFTLKRNGVIENVTISTRSASQQVVGLKEVHQRPTFVVWDDPEDKLNTKTSEAMQKNFDILLALIPAVSQNGRLWVIGTPQNGRCMVLKLQNFDTWTKKTYRSIIDFDTKEVLWPEKLSFETLMAEKIDYERNGTGSKWWSERQCKITGDTDQPFTPDMFRYWNGSINIENKTLKITRIGDHQGTKNIEEKIIPVNFFMGIDPASTIKSTSDFTVIFILAYDADGNIYQLPYWRERALPAIVRDTIVEFAKRYQPTKSGIETTGAQEYLRAGVKEKLLELGINIAGFNRTDGFKPRTEKNERLLDLHRFFYDRKVYFMEGACQFLEEEFLDYPRQDHDDLMDGFYYATRKLIKPDHNLDLNVESDDDRFFIYNIKQSKRRWAV